MLTRRHLLRAILAAPAGASFLWSQTPAPPIQATRLSSRLALLAGDGGNIAIVISPDGLMMVDGGFAERAAELVTAVAGRVDTHPIRLVFDTHWHVDHVGANETLGRAGAKIMAHATVKKWLSQKVVIEGLGRVCEPLKPEGLPSESFTTGGKLTFGQEPVEYQHVANAHTDGDAYLFFPGPNVIHTGDLFFNGTYPFIDYTTFGWIGGMVAAEDRLLKAGDAKTRIIPGHGPLGTMEDLKASRNMLAAVYDRLEAMRKQGKTAAEAVAAAPTRDFDARFGKGTMKPEQFVEIAYTGLLRHHAKG